MSRWEDRKEVQSTVDPGPRSHQTFGTFAIRPAGTRPDFPLLPVSDFSEWYVALRSGNEQCRGARYLKPAGANRIRRISLTSVYLEFEFVNSLPIRQWWELHARQVLPPQARQHQMRLQFGDQATPKWRTLLPQCRLLTFLKFTPCRFCRHRGRNIRVQSCRWSPSPVTGIRAPKRCFIGEKPSPVGISPEVRTQAFQILRAVRRGDRGAIGESLKW